jgi:epoxyqueuosine reductase
LIVEILQNKLFPSDEYIFGTADLTGLIDERFGKFRFGISIAKKLDDRIIDPVVNGPTREYLDYYDQINKEMADTASMIRNELQKVNIESIVFKPTISSDSKEYLSTLSAELSHKMVGTRAGLGWIGKTDLFISKKFGPRLRLVSILIDQKPEITSRPIDKSRCGTCNICVEKCPAKAANGLSWDIYTHRDTFFNAQKCRDKCGELARMMLNVDRRLCGICVAVCPIGKKI